MAGISGHWAFAFGVLDPRLQIYKKKSTEGYQSIPYVVALFSSMLWIYYAFLKTNTTLLITINSFGVFIETSTLVQTVKVLMLSVVGGFGAIILVTQFLFEGVVRGQIVGWICLVFSLCVFVAPLGIVRQVIKTKSVEYMPLLLSVFLTLSAVMWFFYGLLLKDINIAQKEKGHPKKEQKLPEVQKTAVIVADDENTNANKKLPELTQEQIIDIVRLAGLLTCTDKTPVATCQHDANCGVKAVNMPKLQTVTS
ncbi:hypothetical protein HAX54_015644 [Datura stramonium]|uniref:Bidirectional sugar transporter SWEET n=1 Tax=Datura stramonium TaxID=4076 RepID=A0ABS8RIV6_DATST|nr:hypothetical protein [Datura stramonium]